MLGIFLDTEANGLNPFKHRIAEIAFKIIALTTQEVKASYEACVRLSSEDWAKSDPESLRLNGLTFERVSQGKSPEDAGQEIISLFESQGIERGKAVFICQNPSFDRAFFFQLIDAEKQEKLFWPYHWLDLASMYWIRALDRGVRDPLAYPWNTGISKDKIAAHYHLPPESKPHRAMNGVDHLLLCYRAVIADSPQELLC